MAYGIKTGGRKKGSANLVTKGAKENIMQVFEMLGGASGFAEWASENKTEFYRHYAKLAPLAITGADGGDIKSKVLIEFVDTNPKRV